MTDHDLAGVRGVPPVLDTRPHRDHRDGAGMVTLAVTTRPDGTGSQSAKVPVGLRGSGLRQNNHDDASAKTVAGIDRGASLPQHLVPGSSERTRSTDPGVLCGVRA